MKRTSTIAAVAVLLFVGAAGAQPKTTPPPAPAEDPKACAPGERLGRGDLKSDTPLAKDETLSEKLARTDGVLCPPPGVDPEMMEKPPGGGALRVIPPPGGPGGDPSVRPK